MSVLAYSQYQPVFGVQGLGLGGEQSEKWCLCLHVIAYTRDNRRAVTHAIISCSLQLRLR